MSHREMFSRIFQYLGLGEKKRFGLTKMVLDRVDLEYDEENSAFDPEKLMIKMGHVVGTTAEIENDRIIEIAREESDPATPSFDTDKEHLIKAGRCTSMLLIDNGPGDSSLGTAFFVAPSTLITAGHCVADIGKANLIISMPGIPVVESKEIRDGDIDTIKCTVKALLYNPKQPGADIAILDCGSFRSKNFLQISQNKLEPNTVVDIIGYPGQVTRPWVEKHEGLQSPRQSIAEATKLLPMDHLVASRGHVTNSNSTISYYLSSVRGMSGGCLLSGGKAHGVHIGQKDKKKDTMPMAVVFSEPEVDKLLRKHKLIPDDRRTTN